ncbi:MAG: hypothetical protein ACE5IL_09920 [Myxococcota bacterium]
MLDLLVVVDDYRTAYRRRGLALLNRILPPNVFYFERMEGGGTLRVKYSVMSLRDLLRASSRSFGPCFVWARLCQPMRLVHARDEAAEATVVEAAVRSAVKVVETMLPLLPADGARCPVLPDALWGAAFRESYRAEWRFESPEAISEIYRTSRSHYDRVALEVLSILERRGHLQLAPATARPRQPDAAAPIEVRLPPSRRWRSRLRWRLERAWSRALTVARLVKTAATFEGWVPYVLWKVERHTGWHVAPTPRQLRHPFLFGWPVLYQVIRERSRRSRRASRP